MDTTLRDGEQTQGVSFSVNEKVNIAKTLLQALKVDRIEVASAGVSEGEKKAVSEITAWAASAGLVERVEVLGFVDFKRSVNWIHSAGGKVINLLAKGSEKHCREQLGKTLPQHIDDIQRTVEYAHDQGLAVNMYLEDWSNGYQDSPDYVFGLVSGTASFGIEHYMLPDTLGVLSPSEVSAALTDMLCRFPDVTFDFHPHNDYGLATANVLAAVSAGIRSIHCTVNCLGERAGNASLAEVAVALKDKLGMELGIDEKSIGLTSSMVENFSGKWIAANTPIVGTDVFTQTAGIHADGDLKGDLYVTELGPERFARKRVYALGKMSGKASLINNLDELGITLSEEEQRKVLERVVALGDSKQLLTAEDLPFIIADVLESKTYKHIRLVNCSINSSMGVESTASIRVNVKGLEYSGTGRGNGGFAAFMNALEEILQPLGFHLPKLKDYEVHIPRGGETNALTEAIITWETNERDMKTRGVDANQVFASIKAAMRMVNVRMHAGLE